MKDVLKSVVKAVEATLVVMQERKEEHHLLMYLGRICNECKEELEKHRYSGGVKVKIVRSFSRKTFGVMITRSGSEQKLCPLLQFKRPELDVFC